MDKKLQLKLHETFDASGENWDALSGFLLPDLLKSIGELIHTLHVRDKTRASMAVSELIKNLYFLGSGINVGLGVDTAKQAVDDKGHIANVLERLHRLYVSLPNSETKNTINECIDHLVTLAEKNKLSYEYVLETQRLEYENARIKFNSIRPRLQPQLRGVEAKEVIIDDGKEWSCLR